MNISTIQENKRVIFTLQKIDEEINFWTRLREYASVSENEITPSVNGHLPSDSTKGITAFVTAQLSTGKKTTAELVQTRLQNNGLSDKKKTGQGIYLTLSRLKKSGRIIKDNHRRWMLKEKEQSELSAPS